MNRSIGSGALGAFGMLGIVALVAACQSSTVTPSPVATGAATPSVAPATTAAAPSPTSVSTPVTTATAEPSGTTAAPPTPAVTPAPGGTWTPAGSMPADWYRGPVVALAGGGALAIAGDGSAVARWDPATATWTKGPGLNAQRRDFAAVALPDGRVLVVGGSNDKGQAYSSAYVFDPGASGGGWTKVGLMGTARSAPAAAVLADGRVLVAGGAYFDRPAAVSVVYRPGAGGPIGPRRADDIAPSHTVPALATAEVFDPRTGTFSPTGSMRYARAGAVATRLADGRVLVVAPGGELWVGPDVGVAMDPRAAATTEAFDPATGRFALVGDLPAIDRAAIAAAGGAVPTTDPWTISPGSLVALQDGGALLVGHAVSWKHEADVVRTFRFDGSTGAWRQVGPAYAGVNDWQAGAWKSTPGTDLAGSYAAPLPDGRVLVAGGLVADASGGLTETEAARVFDPVRGEWAAVPPMPAARQGGGTAALADGSVLLVGGDYSETAGETATRFVPRR